MSTASSFMKRMPSGFGGSNNDNDEGSVRAPAQESLATALHARRSEYTRPRTIRLKVGTWNVAAKKGTDDDLGAWFVGGRGVSRALTTSTEEAEHKENKVNGNNEAGATSCGPGAPGEDVDAQEAKWSAENSVVPNDDANGLPGDDQIDLYVLGLQEVVDISSATEALRPYSDPAVGARWKQSLEMALPTGYGLVAEQQLIGLLLLVYASPSLLPQVRCISSTSLGTGVMGVMGNKGAVATRIVLGETTRLVFVNVHMSAGTGKQELDRRNWDAAQISSRLKFDPVSDSLGYSDQHIEKLGDEDFAFWFGDLNYRIQDIPGEDVRRLLELHTKNAYRPGTKGRQKVEEDISTASEAGEPSSTLKKLHLDKLARTGEKSGTNDQSTEDSHSSNEEAESSETEIDPGSLQTTIDSLLSHDELQKQQVTRKMFHDGWREGPITFLPTYKYDVGSVGLFDSSEKRRAPSWCDRILFRTIQDRILFEHKMKEEREARERDEHLKAEGLDKAAADEDTLFDYDPDIDGEEDTGDMDLVESNTSSAPPVSGNTGEDLLALENYLSHQRVLSSDHKPLEAVFALRYDAEVPELKVKVQTEVARELDRAENEARPDITLVVDNVAYSDSMALDGVGFGPIRYRVAKQRTVTIANTGSVVAQFDFVRSAQSSAKAHQDMPTWLHIDVDLDKRNCNAAEPSYKLDPGDTCSVQLTICVNNLDLVRALNNGEQLEDVLILRVTEGRDYFLPVRGSWIQSIYGRTLDELIRIPEGGVQQLQRKQGSSTSKLSNIPQRSAPIEVFRLNECIEHLMERVMADWAMLADEKEAESRPSIVWAGWPFVQESWRSGTETRDQLKTCLEEALESHKLLTDIWPTDSTHLARLEAAADVLVSFLDSIQDGVVTEELWAELETQYFKPEHHHESSTSEEKRFAILEILSRQKTHSVTFAIVTAMLARAAQEVANHFFDAPNSARSSLDLPNSPRLNIRRKTLDKDPMVARKQLVCKNYAVVFSEAMIRTPNKLKGKAKISSEENKRELIDIFLSGPR